jgi:hypothetical protein
MKSVNKAMAEFKNTLVLRTFIVVNIMLCSRRVPESLALAHSTEIMPMMMMMMATAVWHGTSIAIYSVEQTLVRHKAVKLQWKIKVNDMTVVDRESESKWTIVVHCCCCKNYG